MKEYACYVEEVTEEKFDEKVIKESNSARIFKSEEDEKSAMEKLRGYIEYWK